MVSLTKAEAASPRNYSSIASVILALTSSIVSKTEFIGLKTSAEVAYRQALLGEEPRSLAVLELAAMKAGTRVRHFHHAAAAASRCTRISTRVRHSSSRSRWMKHKEASGFVASSPSCRLRHPDQPRYDPRPDPGRRDFRAVGRATTMALPSPKAVSNRVISTTIVRYGSMRSHLLKCT